ncbi:rRNA-processing protein FYV7 [Lachancea thermotolerans]|uniref:rRNA-processing protein FYV7 n=1 Tax=Lachancea thermotolerans (strain ATCC 56472 / CBS 6340 / NRRL Y-8284) TaxID=559295 RepID=C5DNQ1_LACTC|nr:KLTH0G18920p [Lachancea thermotolerans CBS 6340]CAR25412.1 KLTH0G18920p [Lachancea thermotolerans CBS 6340]
MPPRVQKHTRESKVRDIQKSLVRRARLRKDYFKALKEEGYTAPEKQESKTKRSYREVREQATAANRKKLDEKKEMKKLRGRMEYQKAQEKRKTELQKINEAKEREKQRNQRSKKVTQRTRSGQPLMGPKIEDLLSKIKADDTYTN